MAGPYETVRSFFWGKDVFISYARKDGKDYAVALAAELAGRNYACVIDHWGTVPGRTVPPEIRRALRSCRAMVLLATKGSGESKAVALEVEDFLSTGRLIIPVDLDRSYEEAPWWPRLEGLVVSIEDGPDTLSPSPAVVDRIVNSMTFRRRDERLRNVARGIIAGILVLSIVGGGAIWQFAAAARQQGELLVQQKAATVVEQGKAGDAARLASRLEGRSVVLEGRLKQGQVDLDRLGVEAARQQRAAAAARAEAQRAAAQAQLAYAEQRRATANNLVVQGRGRLDNFRMGDPSAAIALAFAAQRLSPDQHAAELLQSALTNLPTWRRIDLGHQPIVMLVEDNDAAQFTSDLRRVVYWGGAPDDHRLIIRDLESGAAAGEIALAAGERLQATHRDSGDVAILASVPMAEGVSSFRLFGLEPAGAVHRSALTIEQARDVDCDRNGFPCFSLGPDGTILRHMPNGTSEAVGQGTFGSQAQISVSPESRTVAIVEPGRLTAFKLSPRQTEPIVVSWSGEDLMRASWAADGNRLLLLPRRWVSLESRGYAISLSGVGRSSSISLMPNDVQNARFQFASADPGLDRILVGFGGERSGIDLIDIHWAEDGGAVEQNRRLVERRPGGEVEVGPATFSPSGKYVVFARSIGGGDSTLSSWLEILNLEQPGFNGDPFWRQTISTAGAPVSHIAYSETGDRLAAWHGGVFANIYRLRSAPLGREAAVPVEQIAPLLPEALSQRFSPVTFATDDPQLAVVQYAQSDVRTYNTASGREDRLVLPPTRLLDADLNAGGELIVCSSERLVRPGQNTMRGMRFEQPAESCGVGRQVTAVASGDAIALYDSESLRLITSQSFPSRAVWIGWLLSDGEANAFVWRGNTFSRWASHLAAGRWTALRSMGTVDVSVPSEGNGTRRSWYAASDILVMMHSTGQFSSALDFYDFSSGGVTTRFRPSRQGWPDWITRVITARRLPDGGLLIVLQVRCPGEGTASCLLSARWSAAGGEPLSWVISPSVGSPIATRWDPSGAGAVIATLSGSDLQWVRVPGATIIDGIDIGEFSGLQFQPPLVWPQAGTTGWRLPPIDNYRAVLDRVRMGGLDSAAEITDAQLTEAQRNLVAAAARPRVAPRRQTVRQR